MTETWRKDGSRILVVDDYDGTRELVADILRLRGFCVQEAPDGERAWTILTEDPLFDLVITDVDMPMIDGLELLGMIRRRSVPVEVILLTASPAHQVVAQAEELGAFAVLPKPFELEELVRTVQLVLTKPFARKEVSNR